jgi:hypothetical protein
MAVNKIELKRSAVPGRIPTTSSLDLGELAINTYDGKVFFKQSGSITTIVELATTSGSAASSSFATSASYALSSSYALQSTNANTASNITPAITNSTNNRVLTDNGGGTINGEANLTFDGTTLILNGSQTISGDLTVEQLLQQREQDLQKLSGRK